MKVILRIIVILTLIVVRFDAFSGLSDYQKLSFFNKSLPVVEMAEVFEKEIKKYFRISLPKAHEVSGHYYSYAKEKNNKVIFQKALFYRGKARYLLCGFEDAKMDLSESLTLALELKDTLEVIKILSFQGSCKYIDEKDDSAFYFWLDALNLSQLLGNKRLEMKLIRTLAVANSLNGAHEEAVAYFFKAMSIQKEISNGLYDGRTLFGLATSYKALGKENKYRNYMQMALDIAREQDDTTLEANILMAMAEIAMEKGEYEDALLKIEFAKKIFRELGFDVGYVELVQIQIRGLIKTGEIDSATTHLKELLNEFPLELQLEYDFPVETMVELLLEMGQYSKAYEWSDSLVQKIDSNELEQLSNAYFMFGTAALEVNKPNEAILYFKIAKDKMKAHLPSKELDRLLKVNEQVNTQNTQEAISLLMELNEIKEAESKRVKIYLGISILLMLISIIVAWFFKRQTKELQKQIKENAKKTEKLIYANVMAKEGIRVKSEFITTISHEVRTPLNAILGMSNLLLDSPQNLTQKGYTNNILFSGQNLLVLLNDILDFSKLESAPLKLVRKPIQLKIEIESISSIYKTLAEQKGLKFIEVIHSKLPDIVLMDSSRLKQVLVNLLNNAIKFTSSGFVQFEVDLIAIDLSEAIVQIKVSDSGIGISKEDQKSIFKVFSQVDSSNNRKYEGIGIGLAITKKILEQKGSDLQLKSEPGKGSLFWFNLKLDIPKKEEPEQESINIKPKLNIELGTKCPTKILIVEDNRINQKLLNINLLKMGFKALLAENGKEALELLNEERVDLIFMDIQMPVMDGIEATHQIIRKYKKDRPVIVALTANAMEFDKDIYLKEGMDDYISKPFTPFEIENCIKKWWKIREVN